MSSSSRGSTKYFLTDSSKLLLAVSAKCRPLSVKLMEPHPSVALVGAAPEMPGVDEVLDQP